MRKVITIGVTIATEEKNEITINNVKSLYPSSTDLLDRKFEFITADLRS
ncbi:MAG: hypothetical protein WBP64_12245 [Nitrososphaeraceae archaeon]